MVLNSFGLLFVAYICSFIIYQSYDDMSEIKIHFEMPSLNSGIFQFSGILVLSFFVHNAILPILKNNAKPEKNACDVSIAFILVMLTYSLIGISAYLKFDSLDMDISQNVLDMFTEYDLSACLLDYVYYFN